MAKTATFESTKRYYSKSELQLLRNPQEPQIPQKPQEIAVHPNLGKITDKFYSKKLC